MVSRSESTPPTAGLTAEERVREAAVLTNLEDAARPSGILRFDQFVEIALYGGAAGFYTHPGVAFGPRGAFYTAPEVSDLFGRTLARRIAAEWSRLRDSDALTLVEAGAGDGTLACQLLRALASLLPGTVSVRYVVVERSAIQRARTIERLRSLPIPAGWTAEGFGTVGALGPFRGVLVANELLDAVPFRRWIRRAESWQELGVRVTGGHCVPIELDGPPTQPGLPPEAEEGSIYEVAAPGGTFVREIGDHLVEGAAIVIDYGAEEGELVRARRSGTLAGIRAHRPSDPLAHPGLTDLSTFVNFTRLRASAQRSGLTVRADRSQAEALVAWGIEAEQAEALRAAPTAEAEVRIRLAVKNLLFGFSNFRVLELGPAATVPRAG
ncbi:MAG: SAM-dependent methyltransferase [Thermoplasmata archaeon]|nr:SAM-dependent methyltransferase [Thermoplasmata archaeon]